MKVVDMPFGGWGLQPTTSHHLCRDSYWSGPVTGMHEAKRRRAKCLRVGGLEMLLRQQLEPHVQGCGDVFGLSLGLGAGLGFGHECGRFGLSCRKLISDRSCSVASFDGHNSATLPCDSPISKKECPGYDAVQMEARHEADACANALAVADLALRIVRAQKLSAPIPKAGISCAGTMNILQRCPPSRTTVILSSSVRPVGL